jgi:TM2 domain-containing membrane protein YozV
MVDNERMEEAEERLRNLIHALPQETKQEYYRRIRRRTKDPDTYAALNWSLIAGLHHFYLGNWLRGVIDLATLITGLALTFWTEWVLAGILLIAVLSLFELWELFNSQMIVRRHNLEQSRRLLREMNVDLVGEPPRIADPR